MLDSTLAAKGQGFLDRFEEALSKPDTIWNHPWLLAGAVGAAV